MEHLLRRARDPEDPEIMARQHRRAKQRPSVWDGYTSPPTPGSPRRRTSRPTCTPPSPRRPGRPKGRATQAEAGLADPNQQDDPHFTRASFLNKAFPGILGYETVCTIFKYGKLFLIRFNC